MKQVKSILTASAIALASPAAFAEEAKKTIPGAVASVSPALQAYSENHLIGKVWADETLAARDRALITFAALMTRHETENLSRFVELALNAGVTPLELSETITHLAFYTGWGNATAAAEAAAPVFEARGVKREDLAPVETDLLPLDEVTEANRQAFVSSTFGEVSLGVVRDTEKLLFRDLWLRPGLAPRDRSLVTVAALIAAGQPEQMTFHLNKAMDNGLTEAEAGEVLSHLSFYAGWPKVFSAMPVAKEVFASRSK
nr:carboxymuconolactone decarboxylase family protein [uncultured Cohaesibacter sp.]